MSHGYICVLVTYAPKGVDVYYPPRKVADYDSSTGTWIDDYDRNRNGGPTFKSGLGECGIARAMSDKSHLRIWIESRKP